MFPLAFILLLGSFEEATIHTNLINNIDLCISLIYGGIVFEYIHIVFFFFGGRGICFSVNKGIVTHMILLRVLCYTSAIHN